MKNIRFEGVQKVKGEKIFACDYLPADMDWGAVYYSVMILRGKYQDKIIKIPCSPNILEKVPKEFECDLIITANDLRDNNISNILNADSKDFYLVENDSQLRYCGQPIAFAYFLNPENLRKFKKWYKENDLFEYTDSREPLLEQDIIKLTNPLSFPIQLGNKKYYADKHYVRYNDGSNDEFSNSVKVSEVLTDTEKDYNYYTHIFYKETKLSKYNPYSLIQKVSINQEFEDFINEAVDLLKNDSLPLNEANLLIKIKQKHESKYSDFQDYYNKVKNYFEKIGNLKSRQYLDKIKSEFDSNIWSTLERSFFSQNTDAAFLEPEGGLARYEDTSKTMYIVYGTQSTNSDISSIKKLSNNLIENVVYTATYPGGGFGGRDKSTFPTLISIAALFSKVDVKQLPVRILYDRFEQFQAGLKSHSAVIKSKIAYTDEGKIRAYMSESIFDGGGENNLSGPVISLGTLQSTGAYNIAKAAASAYCVITGASPSGSQRGFGVPQVNLAIECLIDEIAEKQKIDPISIRKINATQKTTQQNDKDITGSPFVNRIINIDILDKAIESKLWKERISTKQQKDKNFLKYGVGFALGMQSFGTSSDAVVIEIRFNEKKGLEIYSSAIDMGQGTATAIAKSVFNKLSLEPTKVNLGENERFRILYNKDNWDKAKSKESNSMSASVTAFFHLFAVEQTCDILFKYGLKKAAEKKYNITISDTDYLKDGFLHTQNRQISISELVEYAIQNNLVTGVMLHTYFKVDFAHGIFKIDEEKEENLYIDALALRKGQGTDYEPIKPQSITYPTDRSNFLRSLYASAGQIVKVEVNTKTGVVKVKEAHTLVDAGEIHHKDLLGGQIEGGFAMALSHTLYEELPSAPIGADGSWNFHKYKIARAADLISIKHEIEYLDTYPHGILTENNPKISKKGIGECLASVTSPAIINAIAHAIGVRINSLPITPDKILTALNNK